MRRATQFVLLVDVGNTSVTLGLATDGRILCRSRVPTAACGKGESFGKALNRLLRKRSAVSAVFCSVVPRVNRPMLRALKLLVGRNIITVSHKIRLGLKVRYPQPETIGADRLANACGVASLYGSPAVVADFGTATTFDVISSDGAFVGGAIAPGLALMTDYLADRTALLPRIRDPHICRGPGKSTVSAMGIGAFVGYKGLVREITEHLLKTMGKQPVGLYATGGYAAQALHDLNLPYKINPDLTLQGLWRIHQLNRTAGAPAQQRPSGK